ncbi:MAG: M23 family metallopeptidase [Acidobacteria bacterium]|nr:MAG: M23 family metallopeptidase [Acidobacteriota bacterium]
MNLPSRKRPRRLKRFVLAAAVVVAAVVLFFELRLGPPPAIEVVAERDGVGRGGTAVEVRIAAPHRGLGEVAVEARQGTRSVVLAERHHRAPPRWAFWRPRVRRDELSLTVGPDVVPGLRSGELELRVTAERAGSWLRRSVPVVVTRRLPVRLEPPALAVLSPDNVAEQGGSGVVVYRAGDGVLEEGGRDGVEAGDWFFPGHPLPGGRPGQRFALYAVPYDLDDPAAIRLVAIDGLGNRAVQAFLRDLRLEPVRTDVIRLSDDFFAEVVPEILAQTPELSPRETLLDTYLMLNGELRRQNAATLKALAAESRPGFLWSGPFLQLPGSQVTSAFADRRTYVYDGRPVDRQDHLGFDLASVRRAPVPAANGGVVVLARYFGIYGNTVVLDHGYGLMSLYSHLSSIDVEPGQAVAKGEILGRTGETGLAAGDHLHFTMLIGGLPVNPLEWWDRRWIENRILAPLAAAGG